MPATLLASQFATLEAPEGAIDIAVDQPVDAQVAAIVAALARPAGDRRGAPVAASSPRGAGAATGKR
jgi:hypothetical protein